MKIVILGAGQAALQTALSLRQGNFDGDIDIVGNERFLPYQRPPLSKAYLKGALDRERLFLKPQEFFDDQNITVHLAQQVTAIDRQAQRISGDNGFALDYDKLVLATGSRPRRLDLPGRDLENIFDLRDMADVDAMAGQFQAGKKLVIIGGGYIGLEAASVARAMGLEVTVLEAAPRLLARVAEPEISEFYAQLHQSHGVEIITQCQIAGFQGSQHVTAVDFADGSSLAADLVITGIGILPNIELAEAAGVAVDNGIIVDELGRTNAAHIYATGDCTMHPNKLLGRNLRLESVPHAIEQSKAVASDILGAPQAYAEVPWFWSDQYDVKLQISGVPTQIYKKILRGDGDSTSFAWFYFTGDKLTGVTTVNRAAEFMAGKQLILRALRDGARIAPEALRDESHKPKNWLAD